MDTVKQAKKLYSNMGLRLAISMIVLYVIVYGIQYLIMYLRPEWINNYTSSLLCAVVPQYLLGMPAMAAILIIGLPGKAPEKKPVKFGWCVICFLISYSLMLTASYIAYYFTAILSLLTGGRATTDYAIQDIILNGNSWVILVVVSLLAPIIEELLFRKLIIDRCGPYGEATSALMSGLVFGLFHGNIQQAIYAFVMGYFFALIYKKTGKVQITIGIHMVINLMGSVLAPKLLELLDYNALMSSIEDMADLSPFMTYIEGHMLGLVSYGLYSMILFGCWVSGIILLIVNRRKFLPAPGEVALPRHSTFKAVVLNPGMIVFIALMTFEITVTLFVNSIVEALQKIFSATYTA